jgi:hypothetical protein
VAEGNGATVLWRLGTLEAQIRDLDKEKADAKDVLALADEVRSLRKAVVAFAFTIGGSAVVFAFSTVALLQ